MNLQGQITSVSPNNTDIDGGKVVKITGIALGAGDIESVTLADAAAEIGTQNGTLIIVRAGRAVHTCPGDVVIKSKSMGVTVLPKSFVYDPASMSPCSCPALPAEFGGVRVNVLLSAPLPRNDSAPLLLDIAHALSLPSADRLKTVKRTSDSPAVNFTFDILNDKSSVSGVELWANLSTLYREHSAVLFDGVASSLLDPNVMPVVWALRDCGRGRMLPVCPPPGPSKNTDRERFSNGFTFGLMLGMFSTVFSCVFYLRKKDSEVQAMDASFAIIQ